MNPIQLTFKFTFLKILLHLIRIFSFIPHTDHVFLSLLFPALESHPLLSPFTLPPSAFRKEQVFHGLEQIMVHQVEVRPSFSPCIKAGLGNPSLISQMPAKHQGQVLISLLGALQTDQVTELHRHPEGLG